MPHFRVDDQLHNHPKARKAGLEAMGLWGLCGSFCTGYGTDGFVPEWYVKTWPRGAAMAKRLVEAKLWSPGEHDGDRGWWFHQFLDPGRNDSRAQVEADRAKWRQKKARQRGESPPMSPRDNNRDARLESRESPGYTQPNPTQPPVVNSGGGVASHDAHEAPPPPCPEHPVNSDAPCHRCRRRRLWDQSQPGLAAHDDQLEQRRRQHELAAKCPRCHGTNVYDVGDDGDDQVAKCWPHIALDEVGHG